MWQDVEVESLAKVMKKLSSYIRLLASKAKTAHNKRTMLLKSMVVFSPSEKKSRHFKFIFVSFHQMYFLVSFNWII
jgi:hypothetical protein